MWLANGRINRNQGEGEESYFETTMEKADSLESRFDSSSSSSLDTLGSLLEEVLELISRLTAGTGAEGATACGLGSL